METRSAAMSPATRGNIALLPRSRLTCFLTVNWNWSPALPALAVSRAADGPMELDPGPKEAPAAARDGADSFLAIMGAGAGADLALGMSSSSDSDAPENPESKLRATAIPAIASGRVGLLR